MTAQQKIAAFDTVISGICYGNGCYYAFVGNYGIAVVFVIAGLLWIAASWIVLD